MATSAAAISPHPKTTMSPSRGSTPQWSILRNLGTLLGCGDPLLSLLWMHRAAQPPWLGWVLPRVLPAQWHGALYPLSSLPPSLSPASSSASRAGKQPGKVTHGQPPGTLCHQGQA